jgi:hypothetical protein
MLGGVPFFVAKDIVAIGVHAIRPVDLVRVVAFSSVDNFHTPHMRAGVACVKRRIALATVISVSGMQLKCFVPYSTILGAIEASHLVVVLHDFRGSRDHPALNMGLGKAGFDGTTIGVVTVGRKAMARAYQGSILESM